MRKNRIVLKLSLLAIIASSMLCFNDNNAFRMGRRRSRGFRRGGFAFRGGRGRFGGGFGFGFRGRRGGFGFGIGVGRRGFWGPGWRARRWGWWHPRIAIAAPAWRPSVIRNIRLDETGKQHWEILNDTGAEITVVARGGGQRITLGDRTDGALWRRRSFSINVTTQDGQSQTFRGIRAHYIIVYLDDNGNLQIEQTNSLADFEK